MGLFLLVILAAVGGGFYLVGSRVESESGAIRLWVAWVIVGSILLAMDAFLNNICGIAENRSELYYERCEGSVPNIPLYAIPLLLAAPFLRRHVSDGMLFVSTGLLVAAAIIAPMRLLSV